METNKEIVNSVKLDYPAFKELNGEDLIEKTISSLRMRGLLMTKD